MAVLKTRGKVLNAPRNKIENAVKKMTPEIYFARKLASNEKKIRDKSLKKLRKWIAARSAVPDAFSDDELMKLWKGLFYCMWMSDKPLIQEDLAETISELVHSVSDRKTGLKFITVALRTMANHWSGIDTWRMDKFLMFVRRIVRHSLEYLDNGEWNDEEVGAYSQMLSDVIMNANESTADLKVPLGLQLHLVNLFPEELAKAGGEELKASTISKMIEPFATCLAKSNDYRLKKDIHQFIFTYLIKQSDEALEYEEQGLDKQAIISMSDAKANRKKAKKVAKRNKVKVQEEEEQIENEEKDETTEENNEGAETEDEEEVGGDDDMEMEESNLDWGAKDPRAGGVDAIIPQIKPDYSQIADMLFQMASGKSVRAKNRKAIYDIVKKFRDLANGVYPLAVDFPTVGPGLTPRSMKSAAKQFIRDELAMTAQRATDKLELKKSYKESKKLRATETDISDELLEDVFEGEDDGGAVLDEEERDFLDLEADDDELDDCEDEEDLSGEDDEISDEDDDISDEDYEISDDEDNILDEEEEEVVVAPKPIAKVVPRVKQPLATFEVENNWEVEDVPAASIQQLNKKLKANKRPKTDNGFSVSTFEVKNKWEVEDTPTSMQQLKQKLKANKRPKSENGFSESLAKGETEIVIPSKKFKGSVKLQPAQVQEAATPENPKSNSSNNSSGNRRVNFVLNKNTAQEPKDYQESLRKSPGVPHDPDRQPSGGVLKRNDTARTKVAPSSPVSRKPQRGAAKFFH